VTGILKATKDRKIPQILKMTKLYLGCEYYVISPPATHPPIPPNPIQILAKANNSYDPLT
jgi:hypothetical protein